jgi:arginase
VPDVILLPFHQDERLPDHTIGLPSTVLARVVDPDLPDDDQWTRLVTLYDALAHQVAAGAAAGPTVSVTGDCLATLGTLVGLQRADITPTIVWFDAHGDVHTLASSESGYLGGMALRMAMSGDLARIGGPLGLRPLREDQAVLVDARDLDPAEADYLAGSQVRHTTVADVSASDLPDGPVLLHVDVDVIDASEVPGLRFPAANGPSSASVGSALRRLLASGQVAAFDIACPWREPATSAESEVRSDVLTRLLALAAT